MKIHALIEEIQPRLHLVLHPAQSVFKKAVTKVMSSSSSSSASSSSSSSVGLAEKRLGETMTKNGQRLGEDSLYGQALVEYGSTWSQLAEAKVAQEQCVSQEVLQPIHDLERGDLKQVLQHVKNRDARQHDLGQLRQKLQKKKQQQKSVVAIEEDIRLAQVKLNEASQLAQDSVDNFLEVEPEQLLLLQRLVHAQLQLHARSVEILETCQGELQRQLQRQQRAADQPKKTHRVKRVFESHDDQDVDYFDDDDDDDDDGRANRGRMDDDDVDEEIRQLRHDFSASDRGGGGGFVDVPLQRDDYSLGAGVGGAVLGGAVGVGGAGAVGVCVALYDYLSDNEADLNLVCGDVIEILERVDENWLRGRKKGQTADGLFPRAYVDETME